MAIGITRFWVRTIEGLALALFLAIALLSWRLSRGPLPLDSLAPYIENAFASAQPGVELKVGRASLSWASLLAQPTLTAEDVQAVDRRGVIAVLPRMVVQLSVSALLRGTIAPETVSISNATLRIARHPDGKITFGFEPPASTSSSESAEPPAESNLLAAEMISALTQPADHNNRAAYLSSIEITDTKLIIRDESTGKRWRIPKASLSLARARSDVDLMAVLPVVDDEKPWSIKVSGRYVASAGTLTLAFAIDGFRPAGISGLASPLAPLAAVDLRLTGVLDASLALHDNAAQMEHLAFDLKGDHGVLRIPGQNVREYPVRSLAIRGSAANGFDRIDLEQMRLESAADDGRAVTFTVSGSADKLGTQPTITADLGFDEMSLAALKAYWPEGAKENARAWISKNLNGGALSQARFHVSLAGPSLDALQTSDMDGSAVLSGITVNYLNGLPQIEGTNGAMRFRPHDITVSITDGHVADAISGKGIRVRGGAVQMSELGSTHEQARVTLDLAGDFGEVMRLVDHQPLGYAGAMGMDPNVVTGAAKVHLDIAFPLIQSLQLDQLKIAVTATVDGAKVPNAALGQPLTDSHLSMNLDRAGMDVTGGISLGGIPATIRWRENFGGGAFRSRYEVDATLENPARPMIGLSAFVFTPPYIDGPARAHIVYVAKRDGTASIDSESDLTDASLSIKELGWRKDPGAPAHATVKATLKNGRMDTVPEFHVSAGSETDIAGSAVFTDANVLKALAITTGHVGESHLTGDLKLDADGGYHLDVRGPAFNSTYFWKELGRDDARGSADGSQQKTPWNITASFDRMWMAKEGDFRDVNLSYVQSTEGIESINLASKVDGQAPFTLTLGLQNGKHLFHGASANGGGVVRAIGLFNDFLGGDLQIDGELQKDGTLKGKAEIKKLKVVQAPVLARLVSVASLTGLVDQLRGGGIGFDILRVPFTYAKSKITVHNGEMFGPAMGLTGKGTYDFNASLMDFEGTIVPAYTINRLMGSIPLIGRLFTGEKGGGVIAMTYLYRGDVATAEPSVNPLAALTPGITRHIFDIFKGSAPKAKSTPVQTPEPQELEEAPAPQLQPAPSKP